MVVERGEGDFGWGWQWCLGGKVWVVADFLGLRGNFVFERGGVDIFIDWVFE